MDQELWTILKAAVDRAVRAVPAPRRRPVFSDRLIVLMLLWAVWHDRCLSWACDRKHCRGIFRPRALPSISRFIRRVKTERVQQILRRTHDDLATHHTVCPCGLLSYVDAKPALVSPVSKDPDAKRGKISGGFAKGYKLHTIVSEQRRVLVWCVSPLNTDEKVVAEHLVNHLPPGHRHDDSPAQIALAAPLTLGDSSYDSANLHKAFTRQGRTLLTPLRCEQFVGPDGRPEEKLRKMGLGRREVIDAWENHPDLARYVMKSRNNIEGTYSVLSLACGLDRLPGFVRRLPRVRRWIGCKILIYHARLLAQAIPKPHAA
jgi:AraC-like DNA-binding protein